jgi:hypothetical protein
VFGGKGRWVAWSSAVRDGSRPTRSRHHTSPLAHRERTTPGRPRSCRRSVPWLDELSIASLLIVMVCASLTMPISRAEQEGCATI